MTTDTQVSNQRFVSLDVFRGMTIAGMILVNTPGSWSYVYPPLRHAEWHGATPTDLVFPFFLFIVGAAMSFSMSKFEYRLSPSSASKILKRVFLIFVIGVLLGAFPFTKELSEIRFPGVLQRIAIAYGIGAVLCLTLDRKKLIWTTGGILLGYWALLLLGGGADPYALESNLVRKIDLALLGANHLYHGFGIPFDPEGLLSTIPAVGTVTIGFLSGGFIRTLTKEEAVLQLFLWGTVLITLGLIWDWFFPINKPIWTSSYVLYTAGIAQAVLAWFIWLIDIKNINRWSLPFKVFGMNPLFAYVLSGIWVKVLIYLVRLPHDGETVNGYRWLYLAVFEPVAGSMIGSLMFAIVHVIAIWLIVRIMYARQIYIKI